MLATMWSAPEASAIWDELVQERKRELNRTTESGFSRIEDYAASQLAITKELLSEWDASARAWLRAAKESPVVKARQIKLMLILKNIQIPVGHRPDVYYSVIEAWKLALATMEKILCGGSYSVRDGAVLVALSAWHLYPDLVITGWEEQNLVHNDDLVPEGVQVTVGLRGDNVTGSDGVYWSLSLRYLRYYGAPVMKSRSVGSDLDRWTFSDYMLVIAGAVLGHWNIGKAEIDDGLDFLCLLSSTIETLSSRSIQVTDQHNCFKPLVAAVHRYRSSKCAEQKECKKLLFLGWRNFNNILGQSEANFKFKAANIPRILVEQRDHIGFVRSQIAEHFPHNGNQFVIYCNLVDRFKDANFDRESNSCLCSAAPVGESERNCRWVGASSRVCRDEMDGDQVLLLSESGVHYGTERTRESFPSSFTWTAAPAEFGGRKGVLLQTQHLKSVPSSQISVAPDGKLATRRRTRRAFFKFHSQKPTNHILVSENTSR
jgi:hypothetical protein